MWLYLLLLLFSCHRNKNVAPSVAKINFEGNGHSFSPTSDYVLRSVIEQQKNERFSFIDPSERLKSYQSETVRLDAWRLEIGMPRRDISMHDLLDGRCIIFLKGVAPSSKSQNNWLCRRRRSCPDQICSVGRKIEKYFTKRA